MRKTARALRAALGAFVAAATLGGAAHAVDYAEVEPDNDSVPSPFLSGNPVLFSGDRLLGSITENDSDNHFLVVDGSGPAGLYRYSFTLDTTPLPGGAPDSVLRLYDTNVLPDGFGHQLGQNDDFFGPSGGSKIIFDQFHSGGGNPVFDVGIEGFPVTAPDASLFNYALTVERAITPVTALGTLGQGTSSLLGTIDAGAGTWYSFTLALPSNLALDTFSLTGVGDTEMVLFDGAGNTLLGNDNGLDAFLNGAFPAGNYYLAVGSFSFNPFLFEEEGSFYNWDELLEAPVGWDRNGFSGGFESFEFQLNVNVAAVVPEPGTLFLLGVGGLLLLRRRLAAGGSGGAR